MAVGRRIIGRWNYSGDPAASDLDWVRFEIGDTDEADKLIGDAEITAKLTETGDRVQAATACCHALASYFARDVDGSNDGTSRSLSQRSQHYLDLAESITSRLGENAPPWAVVTKSQHEAIAADPDRPDFITMDRFDNVRGQR